MTATNSTSTDTSGSPGELPRWDLSDVHESFESRSFLDAMDLAAADVSRLAALFEEHCIRAVEPRPVTPDDGRAADAVLKAINAFEAHTRVTEAYIYATTSTDSFAEKAEALLGEFEMAADRERPLIARLAEWLAALGVDALAEVST